MLLWTKDRIATLKKLWSENVSCTKIGKEMGCSKNAIVGKAHRLGLPRRRIALTPEEIAEQRRKALEDADKAAIGVGILDLKTNMCKWPVGKDGSHRFCGHAWSGHAWKGDGPYCHEHAKLAYVPKPQRVRPPREPRKKSASLDWMEAA